MTPVEIARQALHRLAELGLAPTPENYETQYRDIAGLPPKQQPTQHAGADQALLDMLRTLLGVISQANDGLQADLTRFSNESSTLLAQAQHGTDAAVGAGTEMLKTMTASASWLLAQVEASRNELEGTRAQLNQRTGRTRARAEHGPDRPPHHAPQPPRPGRRAVARAGACARTGATLCLAVLDIDYFKRINDQFGHAVGDEALKHLARILQPALRETDTLARFGGEEFVLVLPDTPLPSAEFTLNRLLRTLERAPMEADGTQVPVRFGRRTRAVGRAGVAGASHHTRRSGDVRSQAAAGRGCVMVAEEEHPA